MVKFVSRNPGLSALIVLIVACVAFGAPRTGAFLGTHGAQVIRGAWAFGSALFTSAF